MFNVTTILDAFNGFFSRAFWFGSFLPVAVVAFAHASLAAIAFPAAVPLRDWIAASFGDQASSFAVVFAALVVVAYVLNPLIPLFRGLLDGSLLPSWAHTLLRQDRVSKWRKAKGDLRTAMRIQAAFALLNTQQVALLQQKRATGDGPGKITDPNAILAAEAAIRKVKGQAWFSRLPDLAVVQGAVARLATALEKNATQIKGGAPKNGHLALRLDEAHRALLDLLVEAEDESRHQFQTLATRLATWDLHGFQATRIGDARRVSERYSTDTYHVDFDYLWPRLQLAMEGEETGLGQRLTNARSQIDFAILALVLFITIPVAWLPLLVCTGTGPLLFLAVGLITPLATSFFYELVVRSQFAFGELVNTAIDRYRFELLTLLHQPLPATLSAERELWRRLSATSEPGNAADLTYKHPPAS